MDYSLPGSSVHGILQARILEWVGMPSSRRSAQPSYRTWVPDSTSEPPPGNACSVSPYLPCALSTWLTFCLSLTSKCLPAPGRRCWLFWSLDQTPLLARFKRGGLSAGFPGDWCARLVSVPLELVPSLRPWYQRLLRLALVSWLLSTDMVGCCSRILLQTKKLPHPLKHSCPCCWLGALSSVPRPGECGAGGLGGAGLVDLSSLLTRVP